MSDYTFVRNDTLPVLEVPFTTGDAAIDDTLAAFLGTVTKVTFIMRVAGSATVKVNKAGSVKNAATRTLQYAWAAGDLNLEGDFEGEFECVAPTGKRTFPTEGPFTIKVRVDLGEGV